LQKNDKKFRIGLIILVIIFMILGSFGAGFLTGVIDLGEQKDENLTIEKGKKTFDSNYDDEKYYYCWLSTMYNISKWAVETGNYILNEEWENLHNSCELMQKKPNNDYSCYLDYETSSKWLEIQAIHANILLDIIDVTFYGKQASMFLSDYEELKAKGIYDDFSLERGYYNINEFTEEMGEINDQIEYANYLIQQIFDYGIN